MYGQTEATSRLTWLPPDRLMEKLGSVGIPVDGVDTVSYTHLDVYKRQQLRTMRLAPEFAGMDAGRLSITSIDFIGRKPRL